MKQAFTSRLWWRGKREVKKKDTYAAGTDTLLALRRMLMEQIMQLKNELSNDDFSVMPYMNAKGYHNKTIAYSLRDNFEVSCF